MIQKMTIWINWIVIILISISVIFGLAIQFHPDFDKSTQEFSIPISGGADGPTAVFFTTKVDYSIIAYSFIFLVLLLLNTYVIKRKTNF